MLDPLLTGSQKLRHFRPELVVDVFCFHFQFLFTGFAHPMMFAIDEGVIVDAFAVVFGAEIAFHTKRDSTALVVRVSQQLRQ